MRATTVGGGIAGLMAVVVAACGGSGGAVGPAAPEPAAPTAAPSAMPSAEPSGSPAAAAPAASSGPAATGELIGQAIQEPSPASADPKRPDADAQLAAAMLMKAGHKKCLKASREKTPDFKPVHYEIVVTLKADGSVLKVEPDKSKIDVADPAFVACVAKKLKGGSYPAPKREVTARLIYPD